MKRLLIALVILISTKVCAGQSIYNTPDLTNGVAANALCQYFDSVNVWTTKCNNQFIHALKGINVHSIRIPLNPTVLYVRGNPTYLNSSHLASVDTILVKKFIDSGFTVILDAWHPLDANNNWYLYINKDTLNARQEFRQYWVSVVNYFKHYDPTKLVFELANEPRDPGASNVQAQWYDVQDSVVSDIRKVDSTHWLVAAGTGPVVGEMGLNYHLTTAYKMVKIPASKIIYTFHFYQPNILTFQNKQAANDQGTYGLCYPCTPARAKFITDSLINNDCGTCNGTYGPPTFDGTKGELYTYGNTQIWNTNFMDSIINNVDSFSKLNQVPIWMGEGNNYQYGDGGVTTGIIQSQRYNWYDDANAIFRKHNMGVNWWDPTGVAVRIDSNLSLTTPRWDTTLLKRMAFLPNNLSPPPTIITKDTTFNGWNARITYPDGVTDSQEVIVFFPGAGEVGTDVTKLRLHGPHWDIASNGWDGSAVLGNGTHWPVIVSLQPPNQSSQPPLVKTRLDLIWTRFKAKAHARYLTGLSAGGWYSNIFASYSPTAGDDSYALGITAIFNLEGVKPNITYNATLPYPQRYGHIAKLGVKIWAITQSADLSRDMITWTTNMHDSSANSVVFMTTNFSGGGHCCWENFYNHTVTNWNASNANITALTYGSYQNRNIYQWLLGQGDTSIAGGGGGPVPPTVTAAGGGIITLPTSTKSLTSSATNGTAPFTYSWTKVSGPTTFAITTPTAQNTTVTSLVAGVYDFRITWLDAAGLTSSDDAIVTVNNSGNTPPISHAGIDQTITLPTSQITLDGSTSTDPDGTISTFAWAQLTGPSVNIVSQSQAVTIVNTINTPGIYTFELTVVDNGGASNKDTMQLTVIDNPTGTAVTAQVFMYHGTNPLVDPAWNGWNDSASLVLNTINDINGNPLGWQATLSAQTSGVDNTAGYGSGVPNLMAPQGALRHSSYLAGSGARTLVLSNLSQGQLFTFVYGGTRNSNTPNTILVTIGSNTQSLQTSDNYTTPLTFPNISPDASGNITVSIIKQTGSAGNYLTFWKLTRQGTAQNTIPSVVTNPDIVVSLPTNFATLGASGSDPDPEDSTLQYAWQCIGGPRQDTLVIVSPSSATTDVQNLVVGTYNFKVTVTDTHGATASAIQNVNVTSQTGVIVISAGKDTTFPIQQIGGKGDETVRDSTIWRPVASSGPNVTANRWFQLGGSNPLTILYSNTFKPYIYGFVDGGVYDIVVVGSNSTDSSRDTVRIRSIDYQTHYSETPCRSGTKLSWNLIPTSSTALIKTHIKRDLFINSGALITDHPMGGDTLWVPRNPQNGGVYVGVTLGGFGGTAGCPVVVMPSALVTISAPSGTTSFLRVGNGDDSAVVTYVKIDGTKLPGIKYGFEHVDPNYNAAAVGITLNTASNIELSGLYVYNTGVGMFAKMNSDSLHPIECFNVFRIRNIHVHHCFFDSTGTEGGYIGNTSPDGKVTGQNNHGPTVRVDSFFYDHNINRKQGFDGVQIVDAVYEQMDSNFVLFSGIANASSQRTATIMGGDVTGRIFYNVFWNMKEGLNGTPYGHCEIDHNFSDSSYTGLSGSGRPSMFTMYGGATGTNPLSFVVETRDSFSVHIHDNILRRADSFYIRVHNFQNQNSTTIPTEIDHNYIIDGTGRTLNQLISNYHTGVELTHDNQLFTLAQFPVQLVDLSSKSTGPLVQITQGADTKTFTDAAVAFQWLMDRINPPIITIPPRVICNNCILKQQ